MITFKQFISESRFAGKITLRQIKVKTVKAGEAERY
jgi:hypothetical protein